MLSREGATIMATISTYVHSTPPKYLFNGKGAREKLNPPAGFKVQQAEKESYQVENILAFIKVVLFPAKRRMFFLYVNSARLDEEVRKTLEKKSYFLISISGEVAGDIQGNDTNYYHPVKAIYCEYEMKLILEKLRENPKNISTIQR